MKKIVVKREDGGVSIVCPTVEATDDTMLRDARSVSGYLSHRIVDDDLIPSDRTFRNAWTDDNTETVTVDVDISKAQDIKKDMLRRDRIPILEQLDIDFMKAVELKDDELQATIAAKKQELRDITELELPTNVEDLKAFIPDCLRDE